MISDVINWYSNDFANSANIDAAVSLTIWLVSLHNILNELKKKKIKLDK